jgi:hypothetical protein
MNKRTSTLVLTFAILIAFGAGCGKQNQQGAAEEKKGVFASIKDAFDRSIALRCDYSDENGQKTVTYIKNHRIYLESEPQTAQDGKTQIIRGIVKDDKMYIWGDENAKGLIFDFKAVKDQAPKMGDKEIHSTQDIIDKLEEKKDKCRAESIGDDKFELPAKIEFLTL